MMPQRTILILQRPKDGFVQPFVDAEKDVTMIFVLDQR
jgi:hypothetical protein